MRFLLGIFTILRTKLKYGFYLKHLGKNVIINTPLRISRKENISIGDNTAIGYKTWLGATPSTGYMDCELIIGSKCSIGNFNHIYATRRVVIEDSVLTADKVYIADNIHGYENVCVPIIEQRVVQKNAVVIGTGSWLGENVAVVGASIGKHCVIGANSVVTHDIPDFCVAVGAPARVIKKYNFSLKQWEKYNG